MRSTTGTDTAPADEFWAARVPICQGHSHTQQLGVAAAEGGFIGESAFLSGARPEQTATALEPAQLCVFRHADLNRRIEQRRSIGLRMLESLSRRLTEAETRLADYLPALPTATRTGPRPRIALPLAKKDMASLLDTTPQSLSRQLRSLSDAGVVEQESGGMITITDIDALSALTTSSGPDSTSS